MRKLLVFLVELYRRYISPLKKPCCKYFPTCSGYAIEALNKHGAFKGSILSVWRILRCNPWSLGGIDNVPERFDFFHMSAASRERHEAKIYFGSKYLDNLGENSAEKAEKNSEN